MDLMIDSFQFLTEYHLRKENNILRSCVKNIKKWNACNRRTETDKKKTSKLDSTSRSQKPKTRAVNHLST